MAQGRVPAVDIALLVFQAAPERSPVEGLAISEDLSPEINSETLLSLAVVRSESCVGVGPQHHLHAHWVDTSLHVVVCPETYQHRRNLPK